MATLLSWFLWLLKISATIDSILMTDSKNRKRDIAILYWQTKIKSFFQENGCRFTLCQFLNKQIFLHIKCFKINSKKMKRYFKSYTILILKIEFVSHVLARIGTASFVTCQVFKS